MPPAFFGITMKGIFHSKPMLLLSFLLGCFAFVHGQMTINEADDFLCKTSTYLKYMQHDSIIYYSDAASKAFEKVGDWDSYIQTMMKKGSSLSDKRLLSEAQAVYEKALFVAMSRLNSSDPLFTNLYAGLGLLSLWQANYPEAINWFSKQIKIEPDKNSESVAGAEINIGLVYVYLWRFEESRTHCKIGIEILKRLGKANHSFVSNAYTNIGLCYSNEDEYELALSYFEQALDILVEAKIPNKGAIANVYGNIGNMHNHLKNYTLGLDYMNKSLKLQRETWGEKHTWVAHCYHNIGRILQAQGKHSEAIKYTQKALKIRQELLPMHHKDIIKTYTFLGICYKSLDQYDLALQSYKEGISFREQVAPQAMELVFPHEGMSEIYEMREDFEEAIREMDKAILILQSEEGWDKVKNKPKLIFYFTRKAKLLKKYAASSAAPKNIALQKEALQCYRKACELSDYVQRQRHDDASKNKIAQNGQEYGKLGLSLAFSLYETNPTEAYLEQVFWFIENNKASLLHEVVQKSQAELLAGIPDSLRELERSLSLDFTFYDQQLQHELTLEHEGDTIQLKKLKQKTFSIRNQRDSLRFALEKDYPVFRWLNFEAQKPSLARVQAEIGSTDALILEYAFVDSFLYLIAIEANEVKAFQLSWSEADEQSVGQFIAFLHDSQRAQNEGYESAYLQAYESLAFPLYQKLLEPALSAFPQSKQLTIIPDKALGHLPFEALLTAPLLSETSSRYQDMAFVLKSYAVKYNYSASLPVSDSLVQQLPRGRLAAFAPQYEGEVWASSREVFQRFSGESDFQFSKLPATEQEVSQIEKMLGGEVWAGAAASKQAFLKEAGNYRFLHLAMHAFTNDSMPLRSGLVFSPGEDRFLYTYEIYNLPLRAELTVLSACHTGFGKYQQGEGIMSLARAFRYAGSPNIVMSLWQADDQSTAKLMDFFYKNLKDGMGKDEALRQAKLSFIADGERPMPYFWAGFVLMGDGEAVDWGGDNYGILLAIAVLAVVILGFIGWRVSSMQVGRKQLG